MTVNDLLVLSALSRGPAHGYELIKRTNLSAATMYRTLHRLTDAGLLVQDRQQGRQRWYRITPTGCAMCTAMLNRISMTAAAPAGPQGRGE